MATLLESLSLPPFDEILDVNKPSLYLSLAAITFNPTFWNIVARSEYRKKTITKLFGGNSLYGCYGLALTIFGLGLVRDSLYRKALLEQPQSDLIPVEIAKPLAAVLFGVGQLLVVTSTWSLGVTGTFLGDYFGILMDHKVESFPFNVLSDPMYDGSTMCFAAVALWYGRPAGLFITAFVYIVYGFALAYEGPFTDRIYEEKAKREAQKSK